MLLELNSCDWAEVFGEGGGGNCVPLDPDTCRGEASNARFGREDVVIIRGQSEGENDGATWIVWGQLKDGRWFVARGGCDYTGWDCQASNDGNVATSEEELISFGMDEGERERFGVALPPDQGPHPDGA